VVIANIELIGIALAGLTGVIAVLDVLIWLGPAICGFGTAWAGDPLLDQEPQRKAVSASHPRRRRPLMAAWGAFVTGEADNNVVPLCRGASQ
jgi:hypothetical protein